MNFRIKNKRFHEKKNITLENVLCCRIKNRNILHYLKTLCPVTSTEDIQDPLDSSEVYKWIYVCISSQLEDTPRKSSLVYVSKLGKSFRIFHPKKSHSYLSITQFVMYPTSTMNRYISQRNYTFSPLKERDD